MQVATIIIGIRSDEKEGAMWPFTAEARLLAAGGDVLAYIEACAGELKMDFTVIKLPTGDVMLFAENMTIGANEENWLAEAEQLYPIAKAKWKEYIIGIKFPKFKRIKTAWRSWVIEYLTTVTV